MICYATEAGGGVITVLMDSPFMKIPAEVLFNTAMPIMAESTAAAKTVACAAILP